MASIMKYVLNNLNQLPTYCFAEESLMPDSRCKATSTEEIHEVPLVPPGQTFLCHDNQQQQSVRPPPGFAPLDEHISASNVSARSFPNNYSFGNPSNAKTPTFNDAETMTNPFLDDQQFDVIPNDVAKQTFWPIWNENLLLQIKLTTLFNDLLEYSPLGKKIFDNHMTVQRHLNKVLKGFEQALILDDGQPPSSTSNLANGTAPNDVNCKPSSETVVNQEFTNSKNTLSMSNPFGFVNDGSPNFTAFSAYGSNSFAFKTNQNQSDEFSTRVQVPPPVTSTTTPSVFTNYGSPANSFFLNAKNENLPTMKPLSPKLPTNASISSNDRNSSGFSNANEFKETNPFKLLMTGETHILDMQKERTASSYGMSSTSHFSGINPQNYATETKTETDNVNGHVNVINDQNNTPRIVYEAGPVMYNTQNKQDINMRQSVSDSDNAKNTVLESGRCSNELPAQSTSNIATSHTRHDSPHVDEGYVTRPPTDYMLQSSPPIISSEPNYHRQEINGNDPLLISPQVWKQVEIPEGWINQKFQNNIPLQNCKENSTIGTSGNLLPNQNWNCNGRESVFRAMKGMFDSNYVFQFTGNDKERPISMYTNSWNNLSYMESQISAEQKHAACNFYFDSFIFQKVDSVKGVTFIFNIEEEGWMLTHEFVETFTNLRLCCDLIAMLDAMNIKVMFKEIKRSEYPLQFLQLDNYPLNVSRDTNGRIISINLISLPAALRLLRKLKIVSGEEIENAFKKNNFLNGSVLPKMWPLIVIYRDLRRRIEQCSNYRS